MSETSSFRRLNLTGWLAAAAARHAWTTVAIWLAVFLIGAGLFAGLGSSLRESDAPANSFANRPDSVVGAELIDRAFPELAAGQELVVIRSESLTAPDVDYQQFVVDLEQEILALDGVVASTHSYYATQNPEQLSGDSRTMIMPVTLADEGNPTESVRELIAVVEDANGRDGFEVAVGGEASASLTNIVASEDSLITGERIGGPVALLILLAVFGTLVAAGLPLVLGVAAVLITLGGAAIIGQYRDLSLFIVNITFMIGLAVGIDYALFVINRYREERQLAPDSTTAIARTGATSSRAVLFSGLTVIVALAGMLLVPSTIFQSIALGAMIVVAVSIAITLTLLPALLKLLDHRIEWGRVPRLGRGSDGPRRGFWERVTATVLRKPLVSLIASVALLVALALPYATINLGMTGVGQLPGGSSPRTALAILDDEFSPGLLSPVEIVIESDRYDTPGLNDRIDALEVAVEQRPGTTVDGVMTSADGSVTLMTVSVDGEAESDLAHDTVEDLREVIIPATFAGVDAEIYVTGQTAFSRDAITLVEEHAFRVIGLVLGASFLLLLLAFRSWVIPVKSILMNLLSVLATCGVLTTVFQHGVGARLFGFEQTDSIMAMMPLFMFSVLFGLSMDYHVFILSRVKERYDETGDNEAAVIHGLRTTGRVVTGAALIMVAIFLGFALGDFVQMQQMGFGLAFAILLDATVVRTILLPASMSLLGHRNWCFPGWLEWLPKFNIEGEAARSCSLIPATVASDD
ncbi:MAG: MMPL family transporter [Thermomicrobiales bacterium]